MSNEEAVRKQIALLREGYNIGIYPNIVEKVCNECDKENFKFSIINNLGYEQIRVDLLVPNAPFHRASIIGFNTTPRPEWFILDPTYGQFFENKIYASYMFDNHMDFSIELLKQGYIKATPTTFTAYLNGFVKSGAFNAPVEEEIVLNNVNKTLWENLYIIDTKEKEKRF